MAGRGVPGPRHAGTHRQWSGGAPHPPHLRLALLGQGKPEASPKATQQDQADPSLSLAPLPHVQAEGPVWGGRLHPGISPGHSRNPPASWTRPPPRASTALRAQLVRGVQPCSPELAPWGRGGRTQASVCSFPLPGWHLQPLQARQGRTRSLDQQGGLCREPPLPTALTSTARCSGLWLGRAAPCSHPSLTEQGFVMTEPPSPPWAGVRVGEAWSTQGLPCSPAPCRGRDL